MFALNFDTMKRKLLEQDTPILLNKLVTTQVNTPDYLTYMGLFMLDSNDSIHISSEDDGKTVTFYTIYRDTKVIELTLARDRSRNERKYSSESTFV